METEIRENIDNPQQLERLYKSDKKSFEKAFFAIYPGISGDKMAAFWKARLEYDKQDDSRIKISKTDIMLLILACLVTGFLIEIPRLFSLGISEELFYLKNAGLIVLMGLSLYSFLTASRVNARQLVISALVFIISAVYINLLPPNIESHTIILASIHLPLLLWCLYGLIFIDFNIKDRTKRIEYIKYNGNLVVLAAIIMIAGGILTGVTIGLFSAIDLDIRPFYFEYIVLVGLVSVPIVATYVVKNFPSVTNKIAPIIAGIFSPLVLITLVIYLVSIVITGKDPYNDRDFLIVFNLMLLGVMAIIVFSVSESSTNRKQRFNQFTLFLLTAVTLIVDLVALSAIMYRLGEFGFTPNRTAVLGSNLLIFVHLVWIMIDFYKVNFNGNDIKSVELNISRYLPVYALWTVFVVFVLPLMFGFK